jgi:hypothetical protein
MSQKSSIPQAVSFVLQVLKRDIQHLVALLAYEIVANADNNPRFASLINRAAMTGHNASHWTRLRASRG